MCEAVEKYAKSYAEQYAENSRLNERSETVKHMLGKAFDMGIPVLTEQELVNMLSA
jgi:uncharacterized protein YcbK (DUF882 family)